MNAPSLLANLPYTRLPCIFAENSLLLVNRATFLLCNTMLVPYIMALIRIFPDDHLAQNIKNKYFNIRILYLYSQILLYQCIQRSISEISCLNVYFTLAAHISRYFYSGMLFWYLCPAAPQGPFCACHLANFFLEAAYLLKHFSSVNIFFFVLLFFPNLCT